MPTVVALFGVSRAGKGTIGKALDSLGFSGTHLGRPIKEVLEKAYGLPRNYLDTCEGKGRYVPGKPYTYQDLLVRAWHDARGTSIEEVLNARKVSLVSEALQESLTYFDSLRNPSEAHILLDGIRQTGHRLIGLTVTRPGYEPISSDADQNDVKQTLLDSGLLAAHWTFRNDGTAKDLQAAVKERMTELLDTDLWN